MIFPPEFRLLLLACRIDDAWKTVSDALELIRKTDPNWDDLCTRAAFHRVEPQLSALLGKMPESLIPAVILDRLGFSVRENLVGQIRYVSEFFRIRDWLKGENITVIPFKGFWLGEAMYGNIGSRVSSDIDLFIDYHDLERIKKIMAGEGYTGHGSLEKLTEEYIRGELAEYNFDRYEEGVCQAHIEFHWRSTMSFYRMDIGLEDMRSQIVTGTLQGREVNVFSPAANLLLVVMHHGGKEGYVQLRQALDIAHILRTKPDLDTGWLMQQAARFHVTKLLLLGVRIAHELTGVEVPPDLARYMNGHKIKQLTKSRILLLSRPVSELQLYRERLSSWLFKIRSRDGLVVKLHLFCYTLRKILAPGLVPERWRHLFFSRKIRRPHRV